MEAIDAASAGECLWVCPACGDELPHRRRAAHEEAWCPSLNAGARSAGSSDEETCARSPGDGGLRARRGDRRGAGEQGRRQGDAGVGGDCCSDDESDNQDDGCSGSLDDSLEDTPADARRRSWLNFVFLFLMVAPACGAGVLLLQEYWSPAVLRVMPQDAARVKDIFFGTGSWLVHCVNERTAGENLPGLTKAAELLRPESVRVAQVHCWTPMPTKKGPRTLARRFRFRESPEVAMFVSQGSPPQFLDSADPFSGRSLAKQILRFKKRGISGARGGRKVGSSTGSGARAQKGRREHVGRRPVEEDEEERADAEQILSHGEEEVEEVDLDA